MSRVVCVLRVLRVLRALRASWFQWFAVVFHFSFNFVAISAKTSRFRSVRETKSFCKGLMLYSGIYYATDPQVVVERFERENLHELGAERAILQRQTMRRFKRTLFPRPTSRAAHDRQTKSMLSAPRAKIAKILREIQALPTQILRESDAKRTTFSTPKTRHRPEQAQRRRRVVVAATPSEVWARSTSKTQQICRLFATDPQIFERKNLHELGAERAIKQHQTLRRFKRELCARPTSRAVHDR